MGQIDTYIHVIVAVLLQTSSVQGCGLNCSAVTTSGSWSIGGGLSVAGAACVLDLDALPDGTTYSTYTVQVKLELDSQISAITDWYFVPVSGLPAAQVNMENKYDIQQHQLPFNMEFQMTYQTGSPIPTGYCYFPISGGQQVTTTTTTSGPTTTTTQGPTVTTTQGTTTTTSGSGTPENFDVCANYASVQAYSGSGYNYYEALCKSILFYETQRSGDLPANNRVPWRFDSTLNDGLDNNEDLTGGWFDAGDMVKFGFPMASSTTILLWGLLQWEQSYADAGQLNYMRDSVKWPLDYFLKCWKSGQNRFYAQVGNGDMDHNQFVRPEDLDSLPLSQRPSYYVDPSSGGSDLTADTVSALAIGFLVFNKSDPSYASSLLNAAESLFVFANSNRKPYSDTVLDAQEFYASYCCGLSASKCYGEELTQAALWLYLATGDQTHRTTANNLYSEFNSRLSETPWAYDWSDKRVAVNYLMYEVTGNTVYSDRVKTFLQSWKPGGSVIYTPGGLAWRLGWAPIRYASNVAFMSMLALDKGIISSSDVTSGDVMDPYSHVDYVLGSSGRSFMVGFGNNYPTRPHHKASVCAPKPASCSWTEYEADADNYFTVYGAIVGGPDSQDGYQNHRDNISQSEVSCDYNAGFQSAVAGILAIPK